MLNLFKMYFKKNQKIKAYEIIKNIKNIKKY